MLAELLGVALQSSERPRMGLRVGLRIAIVALLWCILAVSVVLLFVALGVALVMYLGKAPALALTGISGVVVASLGLYIAGRVPVRRVTRELPLSASVSPDLYAALSIESLTRQYPLEAVTVAAAAGVFAAGTDGATLARPLIDAVLRSLR